MKYDAGAVLRTVTEPALISFTSVRVRVGHGLIGQWVRVIEAENEVTICYATYPVRRLRPVQLAGDRVE